MNLKLMRPSNIDSIYNGDTFIPERVVSRTEDARRITTSTINFDNACVFLGSRYSSNMFGNLLYQGTIPISRIQIIETVIESDIGI
jgi:hypothetical protein